MMRVLEPDAPVSIGALYILDDGSDLERQSRSNRQGPHTAQLSPGLSAGAFLCRLPARLCLALSVSFWNWLRPPVLYWPKLRCDVCLRYPRLKLAAPHDVTAAAAGSYRADRRPGIGRS